MPIRVVLAEDHALLREGAVMLLEQVDEVELVASCRNLPELLGALDEHRPDVVVTDIRMPPDHADEGIRAAEHCERDLPATGVVILSQYVEPEYAVRLLEAGSEGRGYLLKERVADVEELLRAIRTVHEGGSAIDPRVVDALVEARTRSSPLDRLTPRETEVLGEIATGKSNAAIADALVLTERAVEKHINSIFSKLDLDHGDATSNRRVRAVLLWLAEAGDRAREDSS